MAVRFGMGLPRMTKKKRTVEVTPLSQPNFDQVFVSMEV